MSLTPPKRLDNLEDRTRGLPDTQKRLARMDERGEGTKATLARVEQTLQDIQQKPDGRSGIRTSAAQKSDGHPTRESDGR